jgi:hypothetical protein
MRAGDLKGGGLQQKLLHRCRRLCAASCALPPVARRGQTGRSVQTREMVTCVKDDTATATLSCAVCVNGRKCSRQLSQSDQGTVTETHAAHPLPPWHPRVEGSSASCAADDCAEAAARCWRARKPRCAPQRTRGTVTLFSRDNHGHAERRRRCAAAGRRHGAVVSQCAFLLRRARLCGRGVCASRCRRRCGVALAGAQRRAAHNMPRS